MKTNRVGIALALALACGCGQSGPNVTRARLGIGSIDKAVTNYKDRNAVFPGELDDLTRPQPDGSKAALEPDALVDPWGRKFHYDLSERHPDTGQPLIWSDGPNPGEPGSKIANWEAKD